MELITIEGGDKPKMLYTPYIHSVIREYSIFFTCSSGNEIKAVYKKEFEKGRKQK